MCWLGLPPSLYRLLIGHLAPELSRLSLQPKKVAGDVFPLADEVDEVVANSKQRNPD